MKKSLLALTIVFTACLFLLLAFIPKKHAVAANIKADKKKIVFIAGACSHGPGEHEHLAGCRLLASELQKQMGNEVETVVFDLWPKDSTVLNSASAIVLYMDGGPAQLAIKHLAHLNTLMKKGIGLTCLHYAVEFPTETGGPEFKQWLGGYFETYWSINPTWEADYVKIPKHPVTNGVKPFKLYDEWYYHMRFRDNMMGITPILTAIPPASTLSRPDGPHEGNDAVRKALGTPQHMAWLNTRPEGGRSFGFTGGHYHKNWGDGNVRKLVLNAILWTAKGTVPGAGVPTPELSKEEMIANLDSKPCKR